MKHYIGKTIEEIYELGKSEGVEWVFVANGEDEYNTDTMQVKRTTNHVYRSAYLILENGKAVGWGWKGWE